MDTLSYRNRSFKLGNGSTANIQQSFDGVETIIVQYTLPSAKCVKNTFELPLPNDRECLSSFTSLVEGNSLIEDENCLCVRLTSDKEYGSLCFQVIEAYHSEKATVGGAETSIPHVSKYCTYYVDSPIQEGISQEEESEFLAKVYSNLDEWLNRLELSSVLPELA